MVAAHVNADALERHQPRRHGLSARRPASKRCGSARMRWCGSDPYDGLASAFLDSNGRPRSRWWPIAYAFQRVNDPARGAGPARSVQRRRAADARVCRARPAAWRRISGPPAPLLAAAEDAGQPLAVRIQAVRGVALLGDAARRRGDAPADHLAAGRSEPAARSDHRAGAITRSRRGRPADRSGVGAVALGARGRAAARCRSRMSTRSSARSPALDPDPHWSVRAALATTLGDLRARARAGAADGAAEGQRSARASRGARRAGEDRRDQRRCGVHRAPQVGRSGRARRRGARPGDDQGAERRRRRWSKPSRPRRATGCMWRGPPRSTR